MVQFDQKYYDDIWGHMGGVHRHDYAESWISQIQTLGIKSVLDVGTGCGYFVKRLREVGLDAWGTEISQYALDNCCAPGYVVWGDVRDLPFKDKRFDLVFSQGLWTYIPEEDVDKAAAECHRVGNKQLHNIDHDKCFRFDHFITWKPIEWWNEKLAVSKVLVACVTHISKEYSFQKWINVVKNLTYPNYEILSVDNSPNSEMFEKYKDQIPMVADPLTPEINKVTRICHSMEIIRKKFLVGNYVKWFNLECDVIPETNMLEVLMKFKDADWVGHAYPIRERHDDIEVSSGIGCTILDRSLLDTYSFGGVDESPDAWLWSKIQEAGKYKTVEIYGHCKVKHLDS